MSPQPAGAASGQEPAKSAFQAPLAVKGSPAFVTAHAIAACEPGLKFDEAHGLARLVLLHGGGPVWYSTSVNAPIARPVLKALHGEGLVEIQGAAEFQQRVHFQRRVPSRLDDMFGDVDAAISITPVITGEKIRWMAAATQEGFDLVAAHLPPPKQTAP